MAQPNTDPQQLDIPEFMTWEELEQLPEEIADHIELWDGRVVWLRRAPAEHQVLSNRLFSALEKCTRSWKENDPEQCWRVATETNVFLGENGKSDYLTPDFLVYRCLEKPYQDIRATDTLLVGEVLSPANTEPDIEAKKGRYAASGIPWYWEVFLDQRHSAISKIRAFVLQSLPGRLPKGVRPMHKANYLIAAEWEPQYTTGIDIDYPYPIGIPWSELAF